MFALGAVIPTENTQSMSMLFDAEDVLTLKDALSILSASNEACNYTNLKDLVSKLDRIAALGLEQRNNNVVHFQEVQDEMSDRSVVAKVKQSTFGVSIEVSGYGDCCTEYGGALVWLEYYEKKLRLHIYGDINSEEPTHSISLEGARLSKRTSDS